jgi:hypothetical protein
MGWADAPLADAAAPSGGWQNAPLADSRAPLPGLFSQAGMTQMGANARDMAAGAVRGAGSIGATILDSLSNLGQSVKDQVPPKFRPEALSAPAATIDRRAAMDAALSDPSLPVLGGADPSSLPFKAGKLGLEVLGTAGAGNALALPVRAFAAGGASPVLNAIASGLETGGFRVPGLSLPATIATRIGTGAATGGASAGLVNPDDAGPGAVIGGALPAAAQVAGAVGSVIRRAIGGNVSPEVRALAERAQQLGMEIPADRIVDSKPLNAVASSLNYVPFSGRAATEEKMGSQLNQALSRTFGQNDSNVTMALRRADSDLGGKFDTFLQNNKVNVDSQFMNDLATAGTQANKELESGQAAVINNQINEILAAGSNGQIDGQAAYNIKKTLDRIGSTNSPQAWYALDLKGKLMDALNRSVGPQQATEFVQLRQQYGNMLTLQKLAKNGVEGEVSAARLANLQNIRNPDVQELADIAAQFVRPREGAHGAAQRVYGSMGHASGLGTIGAAGAYLGGPFGAALGAGGTVAAGRTIL